MRSRSTSKTNLIARANLPVFSILEILLADSKINVRFTWGEGGNRSVCVINNEVKMEREIVRGLIKNVRLTRSDCLR